MIRHIILRWWDSAVRFLLIALVIVPGTSLQAAELKLLCGDDLLFIDVTNQVIRDGRTGEVSWENKNFTKDEERGRDYPVCKINVSEYVHISSQKIEFGYKSVFLNNCGSGDFRRGNVDQSVDYTIDRITGRAYFGSGNLHCEKFNGQPF